MDRGSPAAAHRHLEKGVELVAVAGQDCRGASAETAGGMFRGASRPITLSFVTPLAEAWSCTLDELPLKQVRAASAS